MIVPGGRSKGLISLNFTTQTGGEGLGRLVEKPRFSRLAK